MNDSIHDEIEESSISSEGFFREYVGIIRKPRVNLIKQYTLDETKYLGLEEKFEELRNIASVSEKEQVNFGSIIASNFPSFKIPGSIRIPDRYEINEYLRKNPEIKKPVEIGCSEAVKEFENEAQIYLEMFSDPESDYSYPTIYIRQKAYEDNILERIDKISEKIIPFIGGDKGWLIVTTDFQSPR